MKEWKRTWKLRNYYRVQGLRGMEKKTETTIGFIQGFGGMEKKMETTIGFGV